VSLDSYGGNPDLVATREEIHRVAFEIKLAAEQLSFFQSVESILVDPIRQLQFRLMTINISSKLEQLYNNCLLAAERYFTTEAQINRRFEISYIPQLAQLATNLGEASGWKLDQKVSASLSTSALTKPPGSISEMLDRLSQVSFRKNPTVGVDIFHDSSGSKLAIVYIPGTQSIGFGQDTNPLDMQSNVVAMSGPDQAASERAASLAIQQSGISATDEVIFVGHSQGGMVAGNLAVNPGNYIVSGLLTFGAPLAQLNLAKFPVMAVEHVNDPVPNVSGKANPIRSNWATVQRNSSQKESEALLHSHSLESYRNTSEEIDQVQKSGIQRIREKLLGATRGSKTGTALDFVISREF
jgi:hypothetical protein